MRGVLVLAIVLTAVAGGVTIALGGVEEKPEEEKASAEFTGGSAAPASSSFSEPSASNAPVGATVRMRRLRFVPADVAVIEGEAVRFVNRDNVVHDVVAETGSGTELPAFDSKSIPPGGTFKFVPRVRTYEYVCTIHPTVMHGRIAVDPS